MADDIAFTPVLADPPARKRGSGTGRPEGEAKQLARQHPNRWVLARIRPGRKRGSGMLDSAAEWDIAIRWIDGEPFGVDGVVTATYIRYMGDRRG